MTVICNSVSVPSNSAISVLAATPQNASAVSIRNTGSSTVYLGDGANQLFPLASNEFIGLTVGADDTLMANGGGTAGTLVVLEMN